MVPDVPKLRWLWRRLGSLLTKSPTDKVGWACSWPPHSASRVAIWPQLKDILGSECRKGEMRLTRITTRWCQKSPGKSKDFDDWSADPQHTSCWAMSMQTIGSTNLKRGWNWMLWSLAHLNLLLCKVQQAMLWCLWKQRWILLLVQHWILLGLLQPSW